MENNKGSFKNQKESLLYDSAIPLVGMYLEKMKTVTQKHTCTPIFMATLFTIAKTWKQLTCLLAGEWVKKIWYIYTVEYYSASERIE